MSVCCVVRFRSVGNCECLCCVVAFRSVAIGVSVVLVVRFGSVGNCEVSVVWLGSGGCRQL